MRLKSITIQGFRSFAAEQTLDFSALKPGLYHLHGENQVEPELEANGCGKSTLLEALCWCLYGYTSDKLRASSVKNWNDVKEKCSVIAVMDVPDGELCIFRQWGPNILEISLNGGTPKPVQQEEIDQLVGLEAEPFLHSI